MVQIINIGSPVSGGLFPKMPENEDIVHNIYNFTSSSGSQANKETRVFFSPHYNMNVKELGGYWTSAATASSKAKFGLRDENHNLIAETSELSGAPSNFVYGAITPVDLVAGNLYSFIIIASHSHLARGSGFPDGMSTTKQFTRTAVEPVYFRPVGEQSSSATWEIARAYDGTFVPDGTAVDAASWASYGNGNHCSLVV